MDTFASQTKLTRLYFTAISASPAHFAGGLFATDAARVVAFAGTPELTVVTVETDGEADADTIRALLATDPLQRSWSLVKDHTYREVADLWVQMTVKAVRNVSAYTAGEQVTDWYGAELSGPAIVTVVDDVKVGDTIFQSYPSGYYVEVGDVFSYDDITAITPTDKRLRIVRSTQGSLIPVMI